MKTNKQWECRKVKLSTIMPNEKNPRRITEDKFKRLQKKIEEVGFHSPIKVDNEGIILGGNQRYAALMAMGAGDLEVPVMFPMFKLTEKERQEIIITDNVSDGEWDMDALANQFDAEDLADWGLDLPWKEEPLDEDNPEADEKDFDIEKAKVKVVFSYKDSHEIIDKFIREIHTKYPELMFEVQIDD